MAFTGYLPIGYDFMARPTRWEFTQAENTLAIYRVRELSALPHQDLLKVAEALKTVLGFVEEMKF